MSDSPKARKWTQGFVAWIRQPSSWLSLIAAVVSVCTWYFVNARMGEVQIMMPDKVGISLSASADAILLLPVTFSNTGAPRTVNYITHLTAIMLNMDPHGVPGNEVPFRWRYELTTVMNPEKYSKEGTLRPGKTGSDDIVKYVGRAFPFALYGGTSATKLFDLVQEGSGFQPSLRRFQLAVHAETPSGPISSKLATYVCESEGSGKNGAKLEYDYQYCLQSYR